jgi:glycosyltransferase involved in cell wall biosynthesis
MTITPPLVAAETMALGVPIVATAVPCITPLVEDGISGRIVPPGDVDALAGAIRWIVGDRDRWETMSVAARSAIERHWSWPGAAAAVDRAYAMATRKHLVRVA